MTTEIAEAASRALRVEELTRYSRHIMLPGVGLAGQQRLLAARVVVIGAGGLGSPALLYLAAAGVGTLGIVDDDLVEMSNLQRQVVHQESSIGSLKTDSAARTVADLNARVRIKTHPVKLSADNALEILAEYDVVVDGTDNFNTRYLVSDACVMLGKPHVWGSVFQFEGQVCVWWAAKGPCYRCAFPEPPTAGLVPSCAEAGVFGAVCGSIGSAQAMETLKLVLEMGGPSVGVLRVLDALSSEWEAFRIAKDAQCPSCGERPRLATLTDVSQTCSASAGSRMAAADTICVEALAEMLRRPSEGFRLIDVRGPEERAIVSIPGSEAIALSDFRSGQALPQLSQSDDVVLYCKSGTRSAEAFATVPVGSVTRIRHLDGGVLAWIDHIDPGLPRY